ncbi:MAG TPA: pilus assembly protein TadG-related protein [Alphaproteobacteria bacterium]|nr:pilus assembly protein TadG-related protein [Alphaproteobacteria bacterium]
MRIRGKHNPRGAGISRWWQARLARLLRDRSGAIALTTALMAMSLMGVAGLAVDAGNWYFTRRAMQTAADAAAIAGARDLANGSSNSAVIASATNDAQLNGFSSANGATVSVVPVSSPQSVTVTISQPAQLLFSGLFLATAPTIQVVAQAGLINDGAPVCMLTLSKTAAGASLLNGNPSINAPGCSLVNDSTSSSALLVNGNVTIDTAKTCGPGGYTANGNVTFSPPPSKCSAMADPLANLPAPSEANGGCNFNNYSLNGTTSVTLSPGIYCGGITINGTNKVTMQPGVYVMKNGGFVVNGNANISGTGVGFYLTGSNTSFTLNGNGAVQLSAPTSGDMAGLLVYEDHALRADSVPNVLNGNNSVSYEGTFYFGKQNVTFNGNGNINSQSPWTMVIADTMTFNGNDTWNFNANFQNSQVPPPPGMKLPTVTLTE